MLKRQPTRFRRLAAIMLAMGIVALRSVQLRADEYPSDSWAPRRAGRQGRRKRGRRASPVCRPNPRLRRLRKQSPRNILQRRPQKPQPTRPFSHRRQWLPAIGAIAPWWDHRPCAATVRHAKHGTCSRTTSRACVDSASSPRACPGPNPFTRRTRCSRRAVRRRHVPALFAPPPCAGCDACAAGQGPAPPAPPVGEAPCIDPRAQLSPYSTNDFSPDPFYDQPYNTSPSSACMATSI